MKGIALARDLAIDLGTANTLVYARGQGIILNEPTVIALNSRTQDVLAMGHEAWQMIGRTPGYIVAVRPLRGVGRLAMRSLGCGSSGGGASAPISRLNASSPDSRVLGCRCRT